MSQMNMISFELEINKSGDYAFVDKLIIKLDEVRFGQRGGCAERGLVTGEIVNLLDKLVRQQSFPEFLRYFSALEAREIFSLLDEGCWGGGKWACIPPSAPSNPSLFSALPAATELFDLERAYFIETLQDCSRLVYRDCNDGLIKETFVSREEYVRVWTSILLEINSSKSMGSGLE